LERGNRCKIPDTFASAAANRFKALILQEFARKSLTSLLNPCPRKKFSNSGQILRFLAHKRKRAVLIDVLVQCTALRTSLMGSRSLAQMGDSLLADVCSLVDTPAPSSLSLSFALHAVF
jgi:hypothetical protein